MSDKKVTSYRLPVLTLQRLDQLLEEANNTQREIAESVGFKVGRKLTRADLLDIYINQAWEKMQDEGGKIKND